MTRRHTGPAYRMRAEDLVPMAATELAALRRIGRLLDDEAELRAEGRRLELDPGRADDARRLFDLASALRAERLRLLDRWLTR